MLRRSLLTAAAIAASVSFGLPADAFWASHGSYGSYGSHGSYGSAGSYGSSGSYGSHGSYSVSYSSTGSYGSYGSTGSYGSAGSYGSYGSHGGGLFARIHARHAARKAARHASYGSYGSYGSTGSHGSTGSYGSTGSHGSTGSYGSTGSHGSTGSYGGHVIYESASTTVSTGVVVAKAEATSGSLRVLVPADAVVYVNDHKTTSTGTMRNYVSHGLNKGESYQYRVRVEFEADGKKVVDSKVATLVGGSSAELAFGKTDPVATKPQTAKTKLTLSVPADAKVTLAGVTTQQSGAEREYLTSTLPQGETWDAYTVAVTVDGKTQEQSITLVGGESQHLVFDFAGSVDKVAAR
jgi:uncharacterized protein (TIGR03000 family)